jgi:Cytochrome P460
MAPAASRAGSENVTLPEGWRDTYVRYSIVDKAERKIVRYIYADPDAFAAAVKGQPFPDNTTLVMEDHPARLSAGGTPLLDQQGRFIPDPKVAAIFAQKKHDGWGAAYPAEKRNGDWEYARLNPDGTRNPAAVDACFTCHKSRVTQDFTFTFWDYLQARN